MPKRDDVSSNEQLLELIRSDEAPPGIQPGDHEPPPPQIRKKFPLKPGPSKKGLIMGVDFGEDALRMVLLRRQSDRQWDFLDSRMSPYSPESRPGTRAFHAAVKGPLERCLKDLGFVPGKCELWAILPSSQSETRLFQIPKAPRKQIANAAYWTFKKEVPATDADKDVFDFEILGETQDDGTPVNTAVGYRVPRDEVLRLSDLFSDIGCPLTGMCLAPFAVQNLFRTRVAPAKERTVAALIVEGEWAYVDVFSSRNLVLSRAIKTGRNRMLQDIGDKLREMVGPEVPAEEGETLKDPIDTDLAVELLRSLSSDNGRAAGTSGDLEIDRDDIFRMMLPTLNRLARKVDAGLDYYAHHVGDEDVGRVFIGGELAHFKRIIEHIEEEIQRPCESLDPFSPENDRLSTFNAPLSRMERAGYVKALGAALAHTSWTPNLLLTYEQREIERRRGHINLAVVGSFIVALLVCFGLFTWQGSGLAKGAERVDTIRKELAECRQQVDKNRLLALAFEVKEKRHMQKACSGRYKGMAVVGELSRITPLNIRLVSVSAHLGRPVAGENGKAPGKIVLDGLVLGERQQLESMLTAYLVRLEGQPLFRQPLIRSSAVELFGNEEALRFTAEMEVL